MVAHESPTNAEPGGSFSGEQLSRELLFAQKLRERYHGDDRQAERVQKTLERYHHMTPTQVREAYNEDQEIIDSRPTDVAEETLDDPTEALASMPDFNLAQARAVYTEFAESEDPDDRNEITRYLDFLSPVDHDAGLELWDHLIRDPSQRVRSSAYGLLESKLSDPVDYLNNQDRDDENVADAGLHWRDVTQLLRAYLDAERNPHRRHQPGAARRQADQPPAPPSAG